MATEAATKATVATTIIMETVATATMDDSTLKTIILEVIKSKKIGNYGRGSGGNNGGNGNQSPGSQPHSHTKNGGTNADILCGTLSGLVREKLKEKERRDALGALREVLPFELSGLLGQASEGMPIQHQSHSEPPPNLHTPSEVGMSCMKCGSPQHWAINCPLSNTQPQNQLQQRQPQQLQQQQQQQRDDLLQQQQQPTCFKCLSSGHWAKDCISSPPQQQQQLQQPQQQQQQQTDKDAFIA